MMNNNVSFTSTFNIVNKCKTYDMFGKEILCSPVEESIKSAKTRIRKEIEASEAEDKDLFLNLLKAEKGRPRNQKTD